MEAKVKKISKLLLCRNSTELTKTMVLNYIFKICLWSAIPLLLLLIMTVTIMILSSKGSFSGLTDNRVLYTLISLSFPTLICLGVIPVTYFVLHKKSLKQLYISFELNKLNRKWFVIATVALLIMVFYAGTLDSYSPRFWLLLFHFFCVGLSEEILARGVILYYLKEVFSVPIAIIISALIFAFLFHSNEDVMTNLMIRFPLGLIFGFTTVKAKSIYPAVLLHWGYDVFITFISMGI